jgi:hypothetical protein
LKIVKVKEKVILEEARKAQNGGRGIERIAEKKQLHS